jgi:hypothetical protein
MFAGPIDTNRAKPFGSKSGTCDSPRIHSCVRNGTVWSRSTQYHMYHSAVMFPGIPHMCIRKIFGGDLRYGDKTETIKQTSITLVQERYCSLCMIMIRAIDRCLSYIKCPLASAIGDRYDSASESVVVTADDSSLTQINSLNNDSYAK